jgi:hypothetical protein
MSAQPDSFVSFKRADRALCKDIQAWLIHPFASTFSTIFMLAIILTLEMDEILGYISAPSPSLVALSTRVVAVAMSFMGGTVNHLLSGGTPSYEERGPGFSFFLFI